jgi:uncharacterized protein (TIGR02246 family)
MSHPALATLHAQRDAWNAGDLAGYLAGCAPDVVYVSARGPAFGRDALAAALAANYPDRTAMGTLTLHVLACDGDATSARVTLRWAVAREAAASVGGFALVVLALREGAWLLTHDATLAA